MTTATARAIGIRCLATRRCTTRPQRSHGDKPIERMRRRAIPVVPDSAGERLDGVPLARGLGHCVQPRCPRTAEYSSRLRSPTATEAAASRRTNRHRRSRTALTPIQKRDPRDANSHCGKRCRSPRHSKERTQPKRRPGPRRGRRCRAREKERQKERQACTHAH